MRIISSFKDYYDIGMGLGQDSSVVFDRTTKAYSRREDCPKHFLTKCPDFTVYCSGFRGFNFTQFLVCVAGKTYPGIIYIHNARTLYAYSAEKLLDILREADPTEYKEMFNDYSSRERESLCKKRIDTLYKYFKSFDCSDWMNEHKFTLVLMSPRSRYCQIDPIPNFFTINPQLRSIEFQKCMSPYDIYQEISMWIGGVLSTPDDPEPVADKYKIQQHGFDKWSFRKLPESK